MPNPHRETIFEFDRLIIGQSTEALIAAFKYEIPIVGLAKDKPLPYYYVSKDLDLSPLKIQNKLNVFKNLAEKTFERGMPRVELWNIMMYRLSLMGLAPMFGSYEAYDIDKRADGSTEVRLPITNKRVKIIAGECFMFDRLQTLPRSSNNRQDIQYFVNDYIKLGNMKPMEANLFLSKNPEFSNTLAYETVIFKRSGSGYNCCVKSIIREDDLTHWNYSPTAIRLKTEKTIFWNIDKKITLSLEHRERATKYQKMSESIEDIIAFDILDLPLSLRL